MVTPRTVAAMSRGGPGQAVEIGIRGQGELEDHHRQIGHGFGHVPVEKLIVESREEQRRGLTADAGEGQEGAGEDATRPARQMTEQMTCHIGRPQSHARPRARRWAAV